MRGRGQFDPDALTGQLTPELRPHALADPYRAFYGLEHAAGRAEHRLALKPVGEELIAVQTFVPDHAVGTAVVCHGYYDHIGLYGHLIDFLVGQGLAVLSFDQPGHGLSTGERATIVSFDAYVETLRIVMEALTDLPGPYHLVGQSMGGAVSMEYLARGPEVTFEEVILFAPLLRPFQWPVSRWIYQAARLSRIKSRPRTITDNAENAEFLALMHADPLQADVLPVQWVTAMVQWMQAFAHHAHTGIPVRMIQGDDDKTVDGPWGIQRVAQMFHLDLLEVQGGRHHLVNESEAKRELMWRWLAERCDWRSGDAAP